MKSFRPSCCLPETPKPARLVRQKLSISRRWPDGARAVGWNYEKVMNDDEISAQAPYEAVDME